MTIRIRKARSEDIPWLLEQLRAFDAFFGTERPLFPRDPDRAESFIWRIIADHPFYVATAEAHGLVGFIAGALAPHPYNPAIRQLTEMFWWVAPEFRQSRAGSLLLDAFIEEGKQRAHFIVMTLEHNSPVRDETLTKRGFRHMSRDFLLETPLDRAELHVRFTESQTVFRHTEQVEYVGPAGGSE